jgi:inner membrane protein
MDPLSQGVLGGVAAQTGARGNLALVGGLGMLSGMSADLDVFIRSDTDPILFLEYHRQFTHSLIFVPFGALICTLLLYWLFARRWLNFGQTYLYCFLGYATHALLDACTSYGTQLFWPFSTQRVAWNNISIIDPLFTLPILLYAILAAWRTNVRWSYVALLWATLYLGFGLFQRDRAENAAVEIAASRGHAPEVVEAKPSFGNTLLWKTIYEHNGNYYVDAIRVGLATEVYLGEAIPKLDLQRDFPLLNKDSQQARDVERFRWFSAGYLAKSTKTENLIIDMRYSMLPNRGDGLWGILLSPDATAEQHAGYMMMRDLDRASRSTFVEMLLGQSAGGIDRAFN